MKIKNHKLTLTVGDDINGIAFALDDNNELVKIYIDSTGTYELVALRQYDDLEEEYMFIGAGFEQPVEISDTVNCTLVDEEVIIITDPTKDASCTVNAVNIIIDEPVLG